MNHQASALDQGRGCLYLFPLLGTFCRHDSSLCHVYYVARVGVVVNACKLTLPWLRLRQGFNTLTSGNHDRHSWFFYAYTRKPFSFLSGVVRNTRPLGEILAAVLVAVLKHPMRLAHHFNKVLGGQTMTATNSPPKTYVDEFNQARAAAGLPPSVDAEGLRTSVFTFSTLMTASSVCMNITFACLLASSMWAKVLLASAYLAADIFKISAPSLTRYFWMRGNHFFSAVIVFGLFVSIALSWISGTGFFSETADQTETTRLTSSSEYQNNQQAQQRMRGEVEALAVSPDAVQAARAELARLHDQWEKAYAQRSTYFERDYTPKQVKNTADTWHNRTEKEVREVMKPLDDAMAEPQAIIDRAAQYQAKVSELERLQDVAPNANSGQAVLPVFESLGEWFEAQPQAVKVKVFVLTSIALELISGIGWLAWGMMGKPRQFTPEELALANYEQRAQRDMMRRAFDDIGSGSNHAGVIEATAEKTPSQNRPQRTKLQAARLVHCRTIKTRQRAI